MRGYTRIIIVGNLGGDPDMRYMPSGDPVVNFSVAVNRQKRENGENADATDWYRVTLFGRQAEVAADYLSKGDPVLVDGRLEVDTWVDRQGHERTTLNLIASGFQMFGTRQAEDRSERQPAARRSGQSASASGGWNFDDDYDDLEDVPF